MRGPCTFGDANNIMSSSPKTPCIGVCSTGIGDSVCRGCKRFAHEVIGWNGYADRERESIWARLEQLLSQVVAARLVVEDESRLREQLARHNLSSVYANSTLCDAYEALRHFGGQLPDLQVIGCRALPPWDQLHLVDLRRSIDDDFYRLSCAHYERYFPGYL